jgi:5-methylcytosine-specific restriction endonuclease McrA
VSRKIGSTKGAKKKADDLFSKIVRSRGACQACGKTMNLQCAHIISRRYSHTRCVERNALCLCAGCHHHYTDHPAEFGTLVLTFMDAQEYDALTALSQQTGKVNWVEVAALLKARWETIEVAA